MELKDILENNSQNEKEQTDKVSSKHEFSKYLYRILFDYISNEKKINSDRTSIILTFNAILFASFILLLSQSNNNELIIFGLILSMMAFFINGTFYFGSINRQGQVLVERASYILEYHFWEPTNGEFDNENSFYHGVKQFYTSIPYELKYHRVAITLTFLSLAMMLTWYIGFVLSYIEMLSCFFTTFSK